MRILHVTDTVAPRVGGIETMVGELVRRQREHHDVRVLTRAEGPARKGLSRDAGQMRELIDWADVVHGHVSVISPLALRAVTSAALQGRPAIASVHSMWTGLVPAIAAAGAATGFGSAPVVWAPVSERAAEPVRRALGPGARIVVVPNAVDASFWHPDEDATAAALDDPAGVRPLTIVAVGRMAPRKRPLALLSMLQEVRRRVPARQPLRAVLAGNGPLLDMTRRRTHALGLDSWVELPGALSPVGVRDLYQHGDLFWAPARLESFGLAALEARTAGLPVLADSRTGIGEFITPGHNGLLARGDRAMVEAAATLLRNPEALARMQQTNRTEPIRHDWQHLLARFDELYAQTSAITPTSGLVGAA